MKKKKNVSYNYFCHHYRTLSIQLLFSFHHFPFHSFAANFMLSYIKYMCGCYLVEQYQLTLKIILRRFIIWSMEVLIIFYLIFFGILPLIFHYSHTLQKKVLFLNFGKYIYTPKKQKKNKIIFSSFKNILEKELINVSLYFS